MKGDTPSTSVDSIAIIGMACRFPGASSPEQLWDNLCEGKESIALLDDALLEEWGIADTLPADWVRAQGLLDGVDGFDAAFFGMSAREAEITDPQQRLFLEVTHEALERAGIDPWRCEERIGVFAGSGVSAYLLFNLYANQQLLADVGLERVRWANRADNLATRVCYKLNLRGPGITVQTSCSTSLVAIAMACQSLLNYQCDVALAGGATVCTPDQFAGYRYQQGGIFSHDGHCRPFDERGDGTVPSSGVGAIVLRRLEDALADGDHVHAVVRGFAVNNDGSHKVSYTAPSVDGQAEAIAEAVAMADVDVGAVGYVECHGTATPFGDSVELSALHQSYASRTPRRGYCALGSIKSNFGHLDTAAGVAGAMKAALAVEHGVIPPTLHFECPNAHFDFAASPFYVNAFTAKWPGFLSPRIAGVSSAGIGGTNAHVVLQEPPPAASEPSRRSAHLVLVSARTAEALDELSRRLVAYLEKNDVELSDVAHTLAVGRREYAHRRFAVAGDCGELARILDDASNTSGQTARTGDETACVYFRFGRLCPTSGWSELYRELATFREAFERCVAVLRAEHSQQLRAIAAGRAAPAGSFLEGFIAQYCLAEALRALNIVPTGVLGWGNGLGQFVAAAFAGAADLADTLSYLEKCSTGAGGSDLGHGRPVVGMPSVPMLLSNGQPLSPEQLDDPSAWTAATQSLEHCERFTGLGPGRLWFDITMESHAAPPVGEATLQRTSADPLTPLQSVLLALGHLWLGGAHIAFQRLEGDERRQKLILPTHPLDRQRHWVEVPPTLRGGFRRSTSTPSPEPSADGAAVLSGSGDVGSGLARHPRPNLPTAYRAPQSDLEEAIAQMWQRALGVSPVGVDDTFFSLGGDSFMAVQMLNRMRNVLGVSLATHEVIQAPTVARLARLVLSRRHATVDSNRAPAESLVRIQPDGSLPPLCMVHPAGGQVLCYLPLARSLGEKQPVLGFQDGAPGQGAKPERLTDLARSYVASLRRERPSGPYFLAGWSMGGNIAFEMTKILEASGERVPWLVLFDAHPSQCYGREPQEMATVEAFLWAGALYSGVSAPMLSDQDRELPAEQCLREVFARERARGLVPEGFADGDALDAYRTWSHHHRILRACETSGRVSSRIVFFKPTTPHPQRLTELLDLNVAGDANILGWQRCTTRPVLVHRVAGDHFSMLAPQHVDAVAAHLGQLLRRWEDSDVCNN